MKYKKKFQATQNPCWHRIGAGLVRLRALRRSGPPSAEGSFLLPFWLLGKPQLPVPCVPAHPGPPPHPWVWKGGAGAGRGGGRAPWAVLEMLQPRPGVTASSIPKNRGVFVLWHPHPHHGKWGSPWMSRGSAARPGTALPVLARLCPCPRLLLGLSSAAPARGGRRAQPAVLQRPE